MRNFVLLLVLISGFLSGYLLSNYLNKDAREALKKAIATGKTLDSEREATVTRLQTELDSINEKHRRELEAVRKSSDARMAEWRRAQGSLDNDIKRSNAKLAESDARLKALGTQRDAASGTDRARLDQEIVRLRKERDDLRQEIEGSECLQARVPHSVFDALNETDAGGSK